MTPPIFEISTVCHAD